LAVRTALPIKHCRIPQQGSCECRIVFFHWHASCTAKPLDIEHFVRRHKAESRNDNQRRRCAHGRRGESLHVCHLSSKIEAADEGVGFSKRGSAIPQANCKSEVRFVSEENV
jgi:hypothetical protein